MVGSIQNELNDFLYKLREITFRLTNVIPERIFFVSRGITVFYHYHFYVSASGRHPTLKDNKWQKPEYKRTTI